jgi:hypothetical protein
MINICELIKEELKNQQRSISWLAGKIGCEKSGLAKLLKHNYMSSDLIYKISVALKHDFFMELSGALYVDKK